MGQGGGEGGRGRAGGRMDEREKRGRGRKRGRARERGRGGERERERERQRRRSYSAARPAGPAGAARTVATCGEGSSGEVLILGQSTRHATPAQLRQVRQVVGLVFQDANDQLFCPTVFEDVAFGPQQLGLSTAEVKARVEKEGGVGIPGNQNYIFLGDFVDRGYFSLETLTLLLCLKARYVGFGFYFSLQG